MSDFQSAGSASPLFGDRFPYPLDGKSLLMEIATSFAAEFNQAAKLHLRDTVGGDRPNRWNELTTTTAYPTTVQQCPRIVVVRQSMSPRTSGIGGDIDVVKAPNGIGFRHIKGQLVTDNLEVSICTLNERLRDDLFLWFQQYVLDASYWMLPQLGTVYDLRCTNAVDDQVEYQGSANQPGFEFYAARMSFQVGYELLVLEKVDELASIVNWQSCLYANEV